MDQHVAARFALALARLRQRQRIGQRDLALLAGVSRATVSNFENGRDPTTGRPQKPKPETIRKLAQGLAIDGLGEPIPGLADQFYALLMHEAGYLPSVWDFRSELQRACPDSPTHVEAAYAEGRDVGEAGQRVIVDQLRRHHDTAHVTAQEQGDRADSVIRATGT